MPEPRNLPEFRTVSASRTVPASGVASRRAQDGFTLVEVLIAITIFSAIFGAAFGAVLSGTRAVETGVLETRLQSRSRELLDRMSRDLRSAAVEPMVVPTLLRFRKFHGAYSDGLDTFDFDNAEILWDEIPFSQYRWETAPGEMVNGKDDNGDGRIDEGRITLQNGGMTVVMANDVPRGGFSWQLLAPHKLALSVAFEVLDRSSRDASTIRSEGEATVFLRN